MPSWSWWRIYCGETKWGELSPHFLQCEEWLLENREECEIDEFSIYWIEWNNVYSALYIYTGKGEKGS